MAGLIKRGEVWIADLDPGFGVEIHKKRPVFIISGDLFNQLLPTLTVIPFTSQILPLGPEKVFISKDLTKLDKDSAILATGIRSIDKIRLIKKIGVLSKYKLLEVEDALKLVLGMIELG